MLGNFVNKVKFRVRRGYDGDVTRNKFPVNLVCSNGNNSPKSLKFNAIYFKLIGKMQKNRRI